MRKRHQYALLIVTLLSASAFTFGGWAIVSVDELPEHFVVGKPTELSFVVRQHGVVPAAGLTPRVTLRSGSTTADATVKPGKSSGHYIASFAPPRAGDWAVRIASGFGPSSEVNLLATRAIVAGSAAPVLTDVERGQRLFNAKGCVSCHVVGSQGSDGYKFGPDLTGRSFPAKVLAKFLKDPIGNRISRVQTSRVLMPQPDLKDREIASLVAYINSPKQVSALPR